MKKKSDAYALLAAFKNSQKKKKKDTITLWLASCRLYTCILYTNFIPCSLYTYCVLILFLYSLDIVTCLSIALLKRESENFSLHIEVGMSKVKL